jgi:hypothetical protein
VVIWEECRAGAWLRLRGGNPDELGDVVVSHQAVSLPEGQGSLLGGGFGHPKWSWDPAEPEGWGAQGACVLAVWIRCVPRGGDSGRAWIQSSHAELGPAVPEMWGLRGGCGSDTGLGLSMA